MGMTFTATKAHYAELMKRLSPRGKLFAKLSTGLTALYTGLGQAFADAHNHGLKILDESHPATADVLLDQWLAAYGLPEPGTVLPPTYAERRALLQAKINTARGQSPARMIAICDAVGVTATVDEWFDAGRPLTWRLVMGADCIVARYGTAVYEDKFTDFTDAGLAAVMQIERAKPAHTTVEYWDV